jgi:hypothetical protein
MGLTAGAREGQSTEEAVWMKILIKHDWDVNAAVDHVLQKFSKK